MRAILGVDVVGGCGAVEMVVCVMVAVKVVGGDGSADGADAPAVIVSIGTVGVAGDAVSRLLSSCLRQIESLTHPLVLPAPAGARLRAELKREDLRRGRVYFTSTPPLLVFRRKGDEGWRGEKPINFV